MKHTVTIEAVKKESLKLLGATLSDDITSSTIPQLIEKDDTYAQYLVNMDESLNRAIMRIVNAGVLPHKTLSVNYAENYKEGDGISVSGNNMFVTMESLAADFYKLVCVDFVAATGNIIRDIDYGVLGEDILLPRLKDGERYIFTYEYAPVRISPFMALSEAATTWRDTEIASGETGEGAYNKNLLGVPDDLASIIPKFVFGELYMGDEPSIAMYQGINQFEAYLADYKKPTNTNNNRIQNIFEGFN